LKNRFLLAKLTAAARRPHGRLIVLTGARQTGKTTLAQRAFPERSFVSLDDPVERPAWSRLSSADWSSRYPTAVLDEVQKVPALLETIRAAYDRNPDVRYLLLGSSQILLLSKVRESLAGRARIEELWPLTLTEMLTDSWEDEAVESRLVSWLRRGGEPDSALLATTPADRVLPAAQRAFERYCALGGMPSVHKGDLLDHECATWLADYRRTYLERDVADLAALRDLEPFVSAQKAAALRTGMTVSLSEVARSASISVDTARRFLRYLELSYQVLLLPAFRRNLRKRLASTPKLHFVDPGVHRSITGRTGPPTGEEFESYVAAEVIKQVRTAALPAQPMHLRTQDGREVDLLLEREDGFVAIEIKMTRRVVASDARHLRGLQELLDKPLLASLLLSNDPDARVLVPGVLALPAAWALSGRAKD
jgi:predicted AAA+ superfamily ATPase